MIRASVGESISVCNLEDVEVGEVQLPPEHLRMHVGDIKVDALDAHLTGGEWSGT